MPDSRSPDSFFSTSESYCLSPRRISWVIFNTVYTGDVRPGSFDVHDQEVSEEAKEPQRDSYTTKDNQNKN